MTDKKRGRQRSPIAKRRAEQLRCTHFGAAAWEITDGKTVLLLDPYFSRLRTVNIFARTMPPPSRDPRPVYGLNDILVSDTARIDAHIKRAHFIFISHSHFNHCMDMPYIAKKTGAAVVGTESTTNIARACGVPEHKLISVRGGEDYEFGAVSVKVISSLHSALMIPSPRSKMENCRYFESGVVPRDVKSPLRLSDYVEGGTLGYFIRFGAHRILALCSMNYIEREMVGLRPTVAFIPASHWRTEVYEYTARLMHALGFPPLVIATNWDAQSAPYGATQEAQLQQTQSFVHEVKTASPGSRVVVPEHFGTVIVDPV